MVLFLDRHILIGQLSCCLGYFTLTLQKVLSTNSNNIKQSGNYYPDGWRKLLVIQSLFMSPQAGTGDCHGHERWEGSGENNVTISVRNLWRPVESCGENDGLSRPVFERLPVQQTVNAWRIGRASRRRMLSDWFIFVWRPLLLTLPHLQFSYGFDQKEHVSEFRLRADDYVDSRHVQWWQIWIGDTEYTGWPSGTTKNHLFHALQGLGCCRSRPYSQQPLK